MENGKLGFTLTKNQKDFLENAIALVVKDILEKKELRNLDNDFVAEKVKKYIDAHKKIKEKIKQTDKDNFKRLQRAKEYKELVKGVRAELREIYGVFILKGYKKLPKLLEELKKDPSIANHNKILKLHKSSKERLPFYPIIYKKMFEITGKPKRIIDLACGLNPFSYPYLECEPEYIAYDLAQKDLDYIKEYFGIMEIKGIVKKIDLLNLDKSNLCEIGRKNDLVLLLKTVDSLETIKRNISQEVLESIKADNVVVSFSSISIGGRKAIKKEKRAWFEKLVDRLGYKFVVFEVPGEVFYILSK